AYPYAAGPGAAKVAPTAAATPTLDPKPVIDKYCVSCHSDRLKTAGLSLQNRDYSKIGEDAEVYERIVKKLQAGMMPPLAAGMNRPDKATNHALITTIQAELDKAGAARPVDPGRPPIHRLNRSEYTNAIRDLFGLDIDGKAMLPADDTGYGFDNI